jgi:hypothetical protein
MWCDRIEIGHGNVSTHVESPASKGLAPPYRLLLILGNIYKNQVVKMVRMVLSQPGHSRSKCEDIHEYEARLPSRQA